MQLRRPIAALVTALALFGGSTATLTACGDPAGTDRSDGTTDGDGNSGGDGSTEEEPGDLPENSDPEQLDDDTQDPD